MNKKAMAATIIAAAKEEFQKKGFSATKVEEVVAKANVKKTDFDECFNTMEDCCLEVVRSYATETKNRLKEYDEHENCRQRLSMYLDSLFENADVLADEGHPVYNLYYDLRNMNNELSEAIEAILEMQHKWIDEQFITMLKTEAAVDQGDRLMAAVSGLLLLVKVTGNEQMFKNQIIQLRSWIRSM